MTSASCLSILRACLVGAVILAAALLLSSVANAATITVTPAPGQLQNAVASAHSGDVIALTPGTYTPTVTLAPAASITLQGPTAGTAGAVINGASIVPDASGTDDILLIDNGISVTVANLTFTGSQADGAAGTLVAAGSVLIDSSTFTGNNGPSVVVGSGSATVRNSTISGNGSDGIEVGGSAVLENVTIASNVGRGVANPTAPTLAMTNSIVWGNAGGDCTLPLIYSGATSVRSLDGDGMCGVGALSSTDPRLGPLVSNGGTTPTRALLAGSPAVQAGTSPCPVGLGSPPRDQRGTVRDVKCDIGPYEMVDATPPQLTVPPAVSAETTSPLSSTVVVSFDQLVTASDDDAIATKACIPASGSVFPLGTTTVSCTATDRHGNATTRSFPVTVGGGGTTPAMAYGKITGGGGVVQSALEALLTQGFRDEVCGPVPDARGDAMVAFNYDALNSSDQGLLGASCRTDAFFGSDIPFTRATLAALNAAPGALGCSSFYDTTATPPGQISPPYQPTPGPWPDSHDVSAPIMSFPTGGTAVAIGVYLRAADCGGTKPTSLSLTTSMISRLLGGDLKSWDDPALRAGGLNPALANCHLAVTRVKRSDRAPTTQALKNYLVHADNARSTTTECFVPPPPPNGAHLGFWEQFAGDAQNAQWPLGSGCSAVVTPAAPGAAAQLDACTSTPGAICWADLPDMVGRSTLIRPSLRNALDTGYAPPAFSARANCDFDVALPGSTAADNVGLNADDNWATDNPAGNYGDVTFRGAQYPVCELSFGLVYTGLIGGGAAVARLGYHQR